MEHSVVTKGSPGCQTDAEEIHGSFHMLESFFHENPATGVYFRKANGREAVFFNRQAPSIRIHVTVPLLKYVCRCFNTKNFVAVGEKSPI
jgi:hypothetical protein